MVRVGGPRRVGFEAKRFGKLKAIVSRIRSANC